MDQEQNIDEWLLDDGIGTNLFGADTLVQLNSKGKQGRELEEYIEDIKESARVAIDQSIAILTPWFFSNMPQFYYQTTPRAEKVRDLHAVITGHIFESKQKLQLWNRHRTKTTFLAPGNDEQVFFDIAESVRRHQVTNGAMYTSNDRLLLISTFFTNEFSPVDMENEKNRAKVEKALDLLKKEDNPEAMKDFIRNLDDQMVVHTTPERMARLYRLFHLAKDREDAVTHLVPDYFNEYARLDIAYKKMPIAKTLASLLYLFDRYEFQVNRCMFAEVNAHTDTPITVFTFIFRHTEGQRVSSKMVPFLKLNKACKSLRWVDTDHFDSMWRRHGGPDIGDFSLNEINLIRSISVWSQIFLSKRNPYYYSEERVRKTFTRFPEILRLLVDLFKARFDPRQAGSNQDQINKFEAQILEGIGDINIRIEKDIFSESLNFIRHILKTNYFFPRKTGLSFRMDPDCLNPEFYPNKPFGFFFMLGREYRGFQVRFRDTARGGMRILMPRDASQYEASFAGLFDEVIGLSYAQQLKNKDIPEGGAKAILLLSPDADKETAALGAVDSILNLITTDPKSGKLDSNIIDYFGHEENIYLGPDENCTNDLIEAFVRQAQRRGYKYPNAFMSSKPGAGINHKEYGVTSEGVNVFLDNLLLELGIDPRKQSFTVKMTGGPDGDVAGNELKILNREYGDNAKVVAVADGFGAAYDPEGLHWPELLRLVNESESIMKFNAEHLSGNEKAFVIPADTVENTRTRNNLYALAEADVFIPAGGRPYTVNSDTWQLFKKAGGGLTAKAVVEGANIFFTETARKNLQKEGMLMFKDSSANKCGVICSSFEILASLILSTEEFMDIKDIYVSQVLEKLRQKADNEAKLLLSEWREAGKSSTLVELSLVLSNVINRVTDLVAVDLAKLSDEELRSSLNQHIVYSYVPDILVDRFKERLFRDIPRSYLDAIISADTAARIVYAEGISWLQKLTDEDLVKTVRLYMVKEQQVEEMLSSLKGTKAPFAKEMALILRKAGARALTQMERSLT
ncbi:NAD-glutamate dehydrogenase domain-containing protein [Acanthopleuribacter pedis]|uniref:NAD-glutamate dehydrogenase n=1 Tax=Acanthopleuribacter pedis TaxID=442870 RepID=A0A8J7Q0H9_9BACT|nr:NAD-glutamate dehydrogenase domain-containing protein [Acanthopleuribacter pedis]MBO1318157.1 NAD-glutamate dehydrogenase [Acanthopleuribacter pedis]